MKDEAILVILHHLCNEARNSVHATFGLMEVMRDSAADAGGMRCLEVSRGCADRLLRSIDDVQELLTPEPAAERIRRFEPAVCLEEVADLLNLAAPRGRRGRLVLDPPPGPLLVRQDRKVVEQVLTRVLDSALVMSGREDILVGAHPGERQDGVQYRIRTASDAAERLAEWLHADADSAGFRNPDDVALEIGVMVAGKKLRARGGWANLLSPSGELAVHFPSLDAGPESGDEAERLRDHHAQSLNILFAEDCDDSYALAELLLRGERIWRAHDGSEALDLIRRQRFDLVFMDVHMPGMDGYTAIRKIREWETQTTQARTPIVVLSSDDLDTQHRCAAQSGCSGYLRKPIRNQDLLDLLARLRAAQSLVG